MVLHLAETMEVPLRERNQLLVAAGFAPTFRRRDYDDPSFDSMRAALDRILAAHEPYPAVIVDRVWNLVSFNAAATVLVEGAAPWLLEPPVNVLRIALHPEGMGSRIRNPEEWSDHILGRLRRQVLVTGDEELAELETELRGYVGDLGVDASVGRAEGPSELAMPLLLDSRHGPLALVTTIATFGTPLDITLAELVIEAFLPADDATMEVLRAYQLPL